MNRTERFVFGFYRSLRISDPCQLTIDHVSSAIKLRVQYWDEVSEAVYYKGRYCVFIDERKSLQQQWQDFGHECCHIFNHAGSQTHMKSSFLRLQEDQAEYFAKHFCVPWFMLAVMSDLTVFEVANVFNVEHDFARDRLEMYQNNIMGGLSFNAMLSSATEIR
ncbi:Phage-like element PBSX protein XkdA [Lentibacillus sp. JNUCC-1]|uniref:ImmA/IrrE family metallo-endopeptidase n=1 Tax=Lentibacillus sp. JNUCC-1 TaxID=2654513 RepID=UPI0013289463|nr:ImmA/IrrE family metallo-endopeptidase [Lentibacillus sp. JNUCC-1]MUV39432.1 Phage-like element PBSX protein XkdA [Lentibacillus sp. JNUCC-1]